MRAGAVANDAKRMPARQTKRPMRKTLVAITIASMALLHTITAVHAAPPPEGEPPAEVKVGIYITELSDLDLRANKFTIAFWIWWLHNLPDYMPAETVEITNAAGAAEITSSYEYPQPVGVYQGAKYRATVLKQWDITNYPFDKQQLLVDIEENFLSPTDLTFVVDATGTKIDPRITLQQWNITNFKVVSAAVEYPTVYGDPNIAGETSSYPAVLATINIERNNPWWTLVKSLIGAITGFLLAMTAFLIRPDQLGDRLFLTTAAVFSVIGNQIVLDTFLPPVSGLPLVFKIQAITFLAILASTLTQVLSSRGLRAGNSQGAARMDSRAAFTIMAVYLATNTLLLIGANS